MSKFSRNVTKFRFAKFQEICFARNFKKFVSREISRNFVSRNFCEILAKTKNLTNFDSDTPALNILFWEDKKNMCVVMLEFR
jgi:hypothetical protein